MRTNRVMSLHWVLLVVVILQCASANPVGPTGPIIEAEGWTPVRSSQVKQNTHYQTMKQNGYQ